MRRAAARAETQDVTTTACDGDDPRCWQEALAAARGDAAARAAFWAHHARQIHAWLWLRWRHGTLRSSLDDAAQEVYLECFRPGGAMAHLDPTRAHHGLAPFLRAIVRNVAQRFERARRREREHREAYATGRATTDAGVANDTAHGAVDHEQLAAALARLERDDPEHDGPHSLRTFVRLHFEQGLPVRAIAHAWHELPAHVHDLRRRACRHLRACLRDVQRRGAGRDQPAR